MQEFLGERCLEPGNPNRRSPEISDRPAAGCASPSRCIGIDIECGRGACREGDRRLPPRVKSCKNDRVLSSLRKRKNFEIFSICSDGGDIEAGDVGCPGAGMARPPWVKSRKNDKVFSSLRKLKNFEIFSICSDGGDIEAGDVGCRGAGMARPPWVKSRKND